MGKGKHINLNRARNMDVDAWRERQIALRLEAHLERREQDFIRAHGADTDAQLIAWVRDKARELGRMPHPLELEGGDYLQRRLGDWRALARRLGYIPAGRMKGELAHRRMKEQIAEAFAQERRAIKAEKLLRKGEKERQPVRAAAKTE